MKAITQDRYGSADVLHLREVPKPRIGADDVLVEVRAAGVDPGVWIFMTGRPYAVRAASGFRRPRVPVRGRDVAGVVAEVGVNVTRFKPGDEVFGTCRTGSYAEFAAAPENRLAHKPPGLTFEQAAAVPISGGTALQAVRDFGKVGAGQQVLITGATGGIGSFAVPLAKSYGATVTAVCGPTKGDLARQLGADEVIDYTKTEVDVHGPRYDVIIDIQGCRSLPLLSRAAAPNARIALVGGGHDSGGLLGGFTRQLLQAPFASMRGGRKFINAGSRERVEIFDELGRLVTDGVITPLITRTYPLEQAPDAIRYLAEGHAAGKVVVAI
ncbi:NAD(P)-dependent alcohol dehydrogenase [Virgisporangium aurantiacum]|uniref:NADPH:quinone reductase n=1 Tax=Virgisporangium aurantiacum TaxID=175570 RepID=A0A8J3ZE57_9ACTN|nr:NAD(P)-dependent alcohol dehydrogenase [Virgisporangium aurantiacum]GIJ60020.1 NADPH:quinone reductase [Virgisporangium aurantiacum]